MSTTLSSNSSSGKFHWVLDWDGTITQKDTLDALVDIAAASKPDFPTFDRWKAVVDAYIADYSSTLKSIVPTDELPRTVAEEKVLLKKLKPVEQRSLDRVSSSQIFEGLTQDIVHKGAQEALSSESVKLRPGIKSFLQRFPDSKILSVNWSRFFISSSLALPVSQILANELDGITKNETSKGLISPGLNDMKIIASDDKLRHLEAIRSKASSPVIYVGDSWTDIECLLAADVGICIRDEPMGSSQKKLVDALERLEVPCKRLRDMKNRENPKVMWAVDFNEIQEWVDGIV